MYVTQYSILLAVKWYQAMLSRQIYMSSLFNDHDALLLLTYLITMNAHYLY